MASSDIQEVQLLGLPLRYSSWTVRPVVMLEYFGIPYTTKRYRLADPESLAQLHRDSPSALVPVIITPELPQPVHDSIAIGEYLNDRYPEKGFWPKDIALRTYGRSIVAELHSGFTNIRNDMTHNFPVKYDPPPVHSAKVVKEVARVLTIFDTARKLARSVLGEEGDRGFLLGDFSIADAFYWPILARFHTYSADLSAASPEVKEYIAKMWNNPVLKKIGQQQFEEVKNTAYNVPHYDNYIKGSEMVFWDIDEVMGKFVV